MTTTATGEQELLLRCGSADTQGESICSAEAAGGYTSEIVHSATYGGLAKAFLSRGSLNSALRDRNS